MTNYNFYLRFFALLKSKYLYFLILGCMLTYQAQSQYLYWYLDSYQNNLWEPAIPQNVLYSLQASSSAAYQVSSPNGCVGGAIKISGAAQIYSLDNSLAPITGNKAFEFLMKPNPTDGSSTLLFGTQFARLKWTTAGFEVTTEFKDNNQDDKLFTISFPFQGLGKASPDYYTDGEWHHIVVNVTITNFQPTLALWVDGQKMIEKTRTGTGILPFDSYITAINASTYAAKDLAINFVSTAIYDGFLDEIALYNSNLTPQSILEHYTTSVEDHQHYNIAPITATGPLPPAYTAPTSIDIDPKEFTPTHGTATGSISSVDSNGDPYDDAIEEFKRYPMPRFKKNGNGDIPLLRSHPNYISPDVSKFYTVDYSKPSPIVWGETGGVNPLGIYGGRIPSKIYRDNMNYLHTELYDKWNYNLMINGFGLADICDPQTTNGLLIQTAMQNPSKPLTVTTFMGKADGNLGISEATDFIYTPIKVVALQTVTNQAPDPYLLSFDNGNINCHIFSNANGYYIRAWAYDATSVYAIVTGGQAYPFTINSTTPFMFAGPIPTFVNIQITKTASTVITTLADFNLEGITEFTLNSATTPCFFTRLGSNTNTAAFPIKEFTSYPLKVTFNYQSSTDLEFVDIITLWGPNLTNATRSNHEFTFTCPTNYNATIFTNNNTVASDYYKITSLLTTVSAGSTYTTGFDKDRSYRIVLTPLTGTGPSYTITFNLTKSRFLCLNTREKCKIYWGGDMVSDPNKIIYLYNRSGNQLITRIKPIYYNDTWDATITKAFLSPFATDPQYATSANLPNDFFKQWGFAYRDAWIVPFIEKTGFNRRINMIAENGEVLFSTRNTDIDFWMRSPGVLKDFTSHCNCGFTYTPNMTLSNGELAAWENYTKTILHTGLDIELYLRDQAVVSHCSTYFANLPVPVTPLPGVGSLGSFSYSAFMNNGPQREAWEKYTTQFIYKPYVNGYREGIFESPTPNLISAQDCAGNSITINYADVIHSTFTDFSIYDLHNWNYTTGREVSPKIKVPFTSPTTNNYYNTNNLYVANTQYWNSENGASNQGLNNIREELQDAIAVVDKFSSPYVTPTSYYASNWQTNFRKDIRPGQWLGMLKYTAVTGAEFFYPFYLYRCI